MNIQEWLKIYIEKGTSQKVLYENQTYNLYGVGLKSWCPNQEDTVLIQDKGKVLKIVALSKITLV